MNVLSCYRAFLGGSGQGTRSSRRGERWRLPQIPGLCNGSKMSMLFVFWSPGRTFWSRRGGTFYRFSTSSGRISCFWTLRNYDRIFCITEGRRPRSPMRVRASSCAQRCGQTAQCAGPRGTPGSSCSLIWLPPWGERTACFTWEGWRHPQMCAYFAELCFVIARRRKPIRWLLFTGATVQETAHVSGVRLFAPGHCVAESAKHLVIL